jgi:hypothetical protein
MWDKIKEFIGERFTEASTGRAITWGAGLFGVSVSPENALVIAQIVAGFLMLFGFLPDKKKSPAEKALEEKALKEKKLAEAKALIKEAESL